MFTRNVIVDGRRTTIRLEASVWSALDEICVHEKLTRHEICSQIEAYRNAANRSQAIRSVVISYYRHAAKNGGIKPGTLSEALTPSDDFAG